MNPFEVIILAVSGALIITIAGSFLNIIMDQRREVANELDLINVLNIHQRGLNLRTAFKAVYEPASNGTLTVTETMIKLNNASSPITGMRPVSCEYESLLITESGFYCLKQ